jgi:hypothetical protein
MKKYILPSVLILFFVLFFSNAFFTSFFKDDFYFLNISRKFDFLAFLSPIRTTFYRPLPTEFFYFFLHRLPFPLITGHICMFIVFLVGVYFLYKSLIIITNSKEVSFFSTFLYLFHFSHVYQLYWFATFQEVLLFTLLTGSLFFILNKAFLPSIILFLLALFSKEQALLFPFVAFFFYYIKYKKIHASFIIYIILDLLFGAIQGYVNSQMPILPEYSMHFSPKLLVNNISWYGLWSLGFPSMMSDYMKSIFSLPFGGFWAYFKQTTFNIYFIGMVLYLIVFALSVVGIYLNNKKERKRLIVYGILSVALFVYFLIPVLPIIHKWMVRLTLPLIFVSVVEGLVLALLWKQKKTKPVAIFLIGLYLIWNYFGIKQHEIISTYALESSITKQADIIFSNKARFQNCNSLYIKDPKNMKMGSWDGSEKLALTLSGDSFLSYYFPDRKNLTVHYEYKSRKSSSHDCIVNADELIQ